MSNQILQLYLWEQLYNFSCGSKCCEKYFGYVYTYDRVHFAKVVEDFGLQMRPHIYNEQEAALVYKYYCHHINGGAASLRLSPESVKNAYILHCVPQTSNSRHELPMLPDYICADNSIPFIRPNRFLFPLKQSIARFNSAGQQRYQKKCPMQPFKDMIIDCLRKHRVLVINGAAVFDKSAAIPMYILEESVKNEVPCKIICVEREQLLAIYNCERLAEYFHEKVGETVAFQVHLQSRISDSSNLIYTTSNFFLRVLMGQTIIDSFRHISHVVIIDVDHHEAYSDLLLRELREALKYYVNLHVLLLSDSHYNQEFLDYFGEGELFNVYENNHLKTKYVQGEVMYVENVRILLRKKRPSSIATQAFNEHPITNRSTINGSYLDRCLEAYEELSTDQCFDLIMYMIHGEYASVNYRHSTSGRTPLIIAALTGNVKHIRILLHLNADPSITDEQNMDALKIALSMGHLDCVEVLKSNYLDNSSRLQDANIDFIDYHLIVDIIHMILTQENWKFGDIIIFLPCYEHMIRLNYYIMKQKILGNLPDQITLFLLYNNSEKNELDLIIKPLEQFMVKIILTTDIAETLSCLQNIRYVIDTGRMRKCIYNCNANCKEYVYKWVSKQSLENRRSLLDPRQEGFCFRLIPSTLIDRLLEVNTPELLNMPLSRICLAAKLLSPYSMVAEYLQETIVKPSFMKIFHCVEHLKKINVFTETEDITWLGCRLIDLPVECYLGKLLVFSILLQCLDPVLTIVSFQSTQDPFELQHYMDEMIAPHKDILRDKMKKERLRLSGGLLSDHLTYLRLYQEWQSELRVDGNNDLLTNEYHYMVNGLLEQVSETRKLLVGALRSSQLIHNKGNLSMHNINLRSNSWPMIKAALVGALYPNICLIDADCTRIKSPNKRELVIHPDSILRDVEMDSLQNVTHKFSSAWIVYGNETNSWKSNGIKLCTLVTDVSIALFAGPSKMSSSYLQLNSCNGDGHQATLYIDDWISFAMDVKEAQLLLKTRQYFYNVYFNYLRYCNEDEMYQRYNSAWTQNGCLIECLEKILTQEDIAQGFVQPQKTGIRPKAITNKIANNLNCLIVSTKTETTVYPNKYEKPIILHNNYQHHYYHNPHNFIQLKCPSKQFYMVYYQQTDSNRSWNRNEWFYALVKVLQTSKNIHQKLTFIIMYSRNPNKLHGIMAVDWSTGQLWLKSCFKSDLYLENFLSFICRDIKYMKNGLNTLVANPKRILSQIDNEVGELILHLFAFRNYWLHN